MKNRRLFRNILLSLAFLPVQPVHVSAQPDSLFDCFPLSVGNQWTYAYAYSNWFWEGPVIWSQTDSGLVRQEILARTDHADSVSWTFREHRTIDSHWGSFANGFHDSTFSDSMTYVLIELKTGRHRLYQQVSYDEFYWDGRYSRAFFSVFPFWRDEWDSLHVYRFCPVDSQSTATFGPPEEPFARPNSRTMRLKKDTGLVSLEMGGTVIGNFEGSSFQLLHKVVLEVDENPGGGIPETIMLFQNYPNPFNPTTTIRYVLPHYSHVQLFVFNTLGQQVATLVNVEVEAGYHAVMFNAEGLASGVYFYRLQGGGYTQVRKMLLVR